MLFGMFFLVITKFKFGRELCHRYPHIMSFGVFRKGGPKHEHVLQIRFNMDIYARGWEEVLEDPLSNPPTPPNKEVMVRLSGGHVGYPVTALCMLYSALMILHEKDKCTDVGGVFTPGIAFAKTSIVEKLDENGLKFELIYSKKLD